jgi:hypothetical protein
VITNQEPLAFKPGQCYVLVALAASGPVRLHDGAP